MKKAKHALLVIFAVGIGVALLCTLVFPPLFRKALLDGIDKAEERARSKDAYYPELAAEIRTAKLVVRFLAIAVVVVVMRLGEKSESCSSCNCPVCGRWRFLLWFIACCLFADFAESLLFS